MFRDGVRRAVETCPGFRVVAEAPDGPTALRLAREHRPEILVLDINMPGLSGLEVAAQLRRERVPAALIFLTLYREEEFFNEAMDAGALGYLLKDSAATEIVAALRSVAAGTPFLSASIAHFLIGRQRAITELAAAKPGLARLTPAERRILRLISEDRTSKEIADELGLSPHTVENHRTHISAKLGLHGAHSLVKFAFANRSRL